jgi:alpha-beta hydrolase superfamily lysophospholipase
VTAPAIDSLRLGDGYEAVVRWWRPARPRGAVLYLHGIESHGGWYEGSGGFLAGRGWTVLMPDRRGSGLNAAARGHAESYQRLLADGAELIAALSVQSGLSHVHLVGVSWGGKYAVALAAAQPQRVVSLSLVAPGLFPKIDLPNGEKFRIGCAMLARPTRPFPLPIHDATMFTTNPDRLAFVEGDPLRLREATAAFLLASRRLDGVARGLAAGEWRGALHLLLAGRDRVIDNEKTRTWLRALDGVRRRISEFPRASHTLEFEPDPTAYWTDLADGIAGASA